MTMIQIEVNHQNETEITTSANLTRYGVPEVKRNMEPHILWGRPFVKAVIAYMI